MGASEHEPTKEKGKSEIFPAYLSLTIINNKDTYNIRPHLPDNFKPFYCH